MTWLAIKLYIKKAWLWCKHHWKIALVAAWTLIIWVVARKNVGAYAKVLDTTMKSYKKEVEVLESSHSAELEKRNEAIRAHNDAIARLEESYKNSLSELTVEKRARYLELLTHYDNDPENINKLLQDEFGFKYVK
jgi:type VI protein secretion system component VasK